MTMMVKMRKTWYARPELLISYFEVEDVVSTSPLGIIDGDVPFNEEGDAGAFF